jgi:hypothetical protein
MASKIVIEKNYRLAVSPVQWGVRPGNIRFALFTPTAQIPVGGISLGGMAAYLLQRMILAGGPVSAKVYCGGASQFVLSQLETTEGFRPWKEALYETPVHVESISVRMAATAPTLPASRRLVGVSRIHEVSHL